ncbi:hypothetical protein OG21DRAFT_1505944 [Imleria badia]|nr:hypothetical protein OG21DRAFT_1505944 [Imleria badia]
MGVTFEVDPKLRKYVHHPVAQFAQRQQTIEMDSQEIIRSAAFLVGGRHIVSGGVEGKIRHWRVQDGEELGEANGCGVYCVKHRGVTGWKMGCGWDELWQGDGMLCKK